jgi:hypothetical protein
MGAIVMGVVVFRCGNSEHEMPLSHRDVHLLDGQYFFPGGGWGYRQALGLDFIAGLGAPPVGVALVKHRRDSEALLLRSLLACLETQKDLLSFSYSYGFTNEPNRRRGGGLSGFRVNGYFGSIDVRPSGYCDLTLSEAAPNGRGRIVEIIDMRVKRRVQTECEGTLVVHRRKAVVGWFEELPKALDFLERCTHVDVEVIHR